MPLNPPPPWPMRSWRKSGSDLLRRRVGAGESSGGRARRILRRLHVRHRRRQPVLEIEGGTETGGAQTVNRRE